VCVNHFTHEKYASINRQCGLGDEAPCLSNQACPLTQGGPLELASHWQLLKRGYRLRVENGQKLQPHSYILEHQNRPSTDAGACTDAGTPADTEADDELDTTGSEVFDALDDSEGLEAECAVEVFDNTFLKYRALTLGQRQKDTVALTVYDVRDWEKSADGPPLFTLAQGYNRGMKGSLSKRAQRMRARLERARAREDREG
jgi:hypothetical protein